MGCGLNVDTVEEGKVIVENYTDVLLCNYGNPVAKIQFIPMARVVGVAVRPPEFVDLEKVDEIRKQ